MRTEGFLELYLRLVNYHSFRAKRDPKPRLETGYRSILNLFPYFAIYSSPEISYLHQLAWRVIKVDLRN
jgi:hypothetical protein